MCCLDGRDTAAGAPGLLQLASVNGMLPHGSKVGIGNRLTGGIPDSVGTEMIISAGKM